MRWIFISLSYIIFFPVSEVLIPGIGDLPVTETTSLPLGTCCQCMKHFSLHVVSPTWYWGILAFIWDPPCCIGVPSLCLWSPHSCLCGHASCVRHRPLPLYTSPCLLYHPQPLRPSSAFGTGFSFINVFLHVIDVPIIKLKDLFVFKILLVYFEAMLPVIVSLHQVPSSMPMRPACLWDLPVCIWNITHSCLGNPPSCLWYHPIKCCLQGPVCCVWNHSPCFIVYIFHAFGVFLSTFETYCLLCKSYLPLSCSMPMILYT